MILIIRPKIDSKLIFEEMRKNKFNFHHENFSSYTYNKINFNFDESHYFLISSVQAARSIKKNLVFADKLIKQGKIFVIGKKVESELKTIRFKKILKTFSSSQQFIKYIEKKYKRKIQLNHLTGSIKNDDISLLAKNNKIKLVLFETYSIKFKNKITRTLKTLLKKNNIKIMMHYSLKASEVFLKSLSKTERLFLQDSVIHLCMSSRIKAGLKSKGIYERHIYVSKKPNHDKLMLLLNNVIKEN